MILKVHKCFTAAAVCPWSLRVRTEAGAQGWTQLQKAERRIGSNAGRANINGSY